MKNFLRFFLVTVLALSFVPVVNAQTAVQNGDVDPDGGSACLDLTMSLRYRDNDAKTNGQVSLLQDFLVSEGYITGNPTGYFGLATFGAVKKFQSQYGFSPTGFVGPLTKAKIKDITCGGSTTYPNNPSDQSNSSSNLPRGCTSTSGYSPATGEKCASQNLSILQPTLTIEPNNIKIGQITLITIKVKNAPANADVVLYSNHPQSGTASSAKLLGKTNSLGVFSISENEEYTSNETGAYNYWVIVGGLKSNNATINVHSGNDIPFNYDFTATPNTGSAPLLVNFSVYVQQGAQYAVHFGDGSGSETMSTKCTASIPSSCSNRAEAYHRYDRAGTYTATLFNNAGCPIGMNCPAYTKPLAKVTITVGSVGGNKPPVINGLTAPTTLKVGETGTWTVRASDPENGSLSYAVNWMDKVSNSQGISSSSFAPSFVQSATFTHSYSEAGTYTVTFFVKDNAGLVAETSVTVVVSSNPVTSTVLKVLNPNGGEVWQRGATQRIKWQPATVVCPPGAYCMTVSPRPANYDIYLEGINSCSGNICTQGFIDEKIASSVPGSFYEWAVPSSTTLGSYRIKVCEAGTSTCDYSDGYLKIEGGLITNPVIYPAKITLLTPSRVKVGEQVLIYGMDFNIEKPNNIYIKNVRTGEIVAISSATRSSVQTSFTVPNDLSVGEYAVYMNNNKGTSNSNSVAFWVDSMVSIQPSITVLSPNGGEVLTLGSQYTIRWNTNGAGDFDQVQINIGNSSTNIEKQLYDRVSTVGYIDRAKGSFLWTIPSSLLNDFLATNSTNSFYVVINGIKNDRVGGQVVVTDRSDSNFSVVAPIVSNSAPRIITETPLPSSINIGQTVNFSWAATDADNDDLSWNIDWGNVSEVSTCIPGTSGRGTQKTASHVWNTVGTYTVKVTVSDCKGGTDSRTFTISPKEIVVVPIYPAKITLLSPTKAKIGETVTVYGMDFNTEKANNVSLKGVQNGAGGLTPAYSYGSGVYTTFTVPNLPAGEYALKINNNKGTADSNSVAFWIDASTSSEVTSKATISSITPASSRESSTVTISGTGFNTSKANIIIFKNPMTGEQIAINYVAESSTVLKFAVPPLSAGVYEVYVLNQIVDGYSNGYRFTVEGNATSYNNQNMTANMFDALKNINPGLYR